MTNKDEIYEHLAQVYLGKRGQKQAEKKKSFFSVIFFVNLVAVMIVLASVFYGLTAFLSSKNAFTQRSIIFALNNNPIRVKYNVGYPYPQVTGFSIPIPKINASKYHTFNFQVKGTELGCPEVVRVVIKNQKKEISYYFIQGVNLKWQKFSIPLEAFDEITDWTNLTNVTFVFEEWNIKRKKGTVLIDDIHFST